MTIQDFLLMKHELLLILAAVIVLIAELSIEKDKKVIINLATILFGVVTVLGFIPNKSGVLFGGMFVTTPLLELMKNILNVGVFIILIQSFKWLKMEENKERISEFFILVFSTLIGMDYMISSSNFLMFFISLELATIPMAALATFERFKKKSAEAGIKFILTSALSSGIMLYGLSMIYGTTGSLEFAAVGAAYGATNLQVLAFIFFFAGLAFKISIAPFHLWTADVYQGAPVNITAYLSVISKGASVFILTIILFTVFQSISYLWKDVLYFTSILTMTVGNLFAIRQKNLKRFLAFSSIAQAGFILLGILAGTSLGMTSVIYFVLIYIFSNLGAFGVVSVISNAERKEKIEHYNGLYKTNPGLSLVMMLSLFSLAGIPPAAGFFGKFFLFTAAAQQGHYVLIFIAVLNATLSLYYYLLVIKAMFINKNETPVQTIKSSLSAKIAFAICVGGIVLTGFSGYLYEYIHSLSFGLTFIH